MEVFGRRNLDLLRRLDQSEDGRGSDLEGRCRHDVTRATGARTYRAARPAVVGVRATRPVLVAHLVEARRRGFRDHPGGAHDARDQAEKQDERPHCD